MAEQQQQQQQQQHVQHLIESLTTNIQKINQNVAQLDSLNLLIASPKDCNDLRDKIDQVMILTKKCLNICQLNVRELTSLCPPDNIQLRQRKDQFAGELIKAVNKFKNAAQTTLSKAEIHDIMCNGSRLNALYKTNVDEADTSSVSGIIDEGDDEDQRVSDRRSNEQLLSDAEERRRERKLALIRKDIADLNTIVRNLALHVQQQQSYEIDLAETNLDRTGMEIDDSIYSTRCEMLRSQRRKRKLILATTIAILIAICILAVLGYYFVQTNLLRVG